LAQSQLPPEFSKLYQKYLEIVETFNSGKIEASSYQAEIDNLRLKDNKGDEWRISKDGRWYYHNGIEWLQREPPQSQAEPSLPEERVNLPQAQTPDGPNPNSTPLPKKKKRVWLFIVIPIAVIACCVVLAILAYSFGLLNWYLTDDRVDQPQEITLIDNQDPVELSEDQHLVYDDFGWPDTFTISEIDNLEGIPIRYETWVFYNGKSSFTFADGVFIASGEAQALPEGYIPAPYQPNQIKLGASTEQVKEWMGSNPFTAVEESDNIQEGGEFFVGQQILLGFLDDRLFFVDTFAFVPEGSEQ
jgi:hypothetical protein